MEYTLSSGLVLLHLYEKANVVKHAHDENYMQTMWLATFMCDCNKCKTI